MPIAPLAGRGRDPRQREGEGRHRSAPPILRRGPQRRCQLRLPLDRQRRGLFRSRQALCRPLFGGAGGDLRRGGFANPRPGRPRRRPDLGRLAIGQPLFDDPGPRSLSAGRQDQLVFRGGPVVPPPGDAGGAPGPGGRPVQRPLLLRRATRLPQNHRHDLHDRDDDPRRPRPRGPAQILPRLAPRATRPRPAPRPLHAITTRTNSPSASTR